MRDLENRVTGEVLEALGDNPLETMLETMRAFAARGNWVESAPGVFDIDVGFGVLPPIDEADEQRLRRAEEKRRRKMHRRLNIMAR